jgi:hypothetical protein
LASAAKIFSKIVRGELKITALEEFMTQVLHRDILMGVHLLDSRINLQKGLLIQRDIKVKLLTYLNSRVLRFLLIKIIWNKLLFLLIVDLTSVFFSHQLGRFYRQDQENMELIVTLMRLMGFCKIKIFHKNKVWINQLTHLTTVQIIKAKKVCQPHLIEINFKIFPYQISVTKS